MSATSLTLPPEASSVPAARRFVSQTLVEWGLQAAADEAEMLISELATNALLHARTAFTVEVSRVGDAIRVTVSDGSKAAPAQRSYGRDSTTGRGLRLVDTLSSAWGVVTVDDGKSVWFELPAGGDADRVFAGWEDEVDVDALLAEFDDEGDIGASTPSVALLRREAA